MRLLLIHANPIDDIAALTILTTHQGEAKAVFFDSQQISLTRPELVRKRKEPPSGNGDLPSQREIFPGPGEKRTKAPVLSSKPQSYPLRC